MLRRRTPASLILVSQNVYIQIARKARRRLIVPNLTNLFLALRLEHSIKLYG